MKYFIVVLFLCSAVLFHIEFLLHLIFEHTLDFIAHGFSAGLAEMDANLISIHHLKNSAYRPLSHYHWNLQSPSGRS